MRLSDGSIQIILKDTTTNTFTLLEKCEELFPSDDRSSTGNDVTAFTLYDDSGHVCRLFGDGGGGGGSSGLNRAPGWLERTASGNYEEDESMNNVVFATISRDGTLDLYSLPSLKKLWSSGGVSDGREILAPNSTGIDSIDFNDDSDVEKYDVSDIRTRRFRQRRSRTATFDVLPCRWCGLGVPSIQVAFFERTSIRSRTD